MLKYFTLLQLCFVLPFISASAAGEPPQGFDGKYPKAQTPTETSHFIPSRRPIFDQLGEPSLGASSAPDTVNVAKLPHFDRSQVTGEDEVHEQGSEPGIPTQQKMHQYINNSNKKDIITNARTPEQIQASGQQQAEWEAISNTGWSPPDLTIASGPNHIIEAANPGFSIYSKLGNEVQAFTTFDDFFDSRKPSAWAGNFFDPKLLWSNEHNKYVMLTLGKDNTNQTSHFFIAISQTDNPLGNWWTWRFDRTNTGGETDAWLDYTMISADNWGIYITGNMHLWTTGFKYSILQTINVDAFNGGNTNGWIFRDLKWPDDSNIFSLQPAFPHSVNGNSETFFVNSQFSSGNSVLFWTLSGDRTNSPSLTKTEITGLPQYNAIGENVDQKDSVVDIDGGNASIKNAIYDDRRVYGALTTDINNDGTRSGILMFSINTDTEALAYSDTISAGSGNYLFYPSLITHANQSPPDIAIFYSYSGANNFPSAGVAIYDDVPNTDNLSVYSILKSGEASYVNNLNGRNRWGDYMGAAYDWFCKYAVGATEYSLIGNDWSSVINMYSMGSNPACALIDVTYPDGGESLYQDSNITVRWQKTDVPIGNNLYILFDADNDTNNWEASYGPFSTETTSHSLLLPNIITQQGRFCVGTQVAGNWEVLNCSDSFFELKQKFDLYASTFTAPISALPSEYINTELVIQNLGPVASDFHTIDWRLSDNSICSTSDTLITTGVFIPLPANSSRNISRGLNIPASTQLGDYTLCAMVDPNNSLPELLENNNISSRNIEITADTDLLISTFSTPSNLIAGQNYVIDNSIQNTGTVSSTSFEVEFRLSSNSICTELDPLLTTRTISSLAAGASNQQNTSFSLPASTLAGNPYLCMIIDRIDSVSETDNANNSQANLISIQSAADLKFINTHLPQAANAGDSFTVPFTVFNDGETSTTNFAVEFRLSTDDICSNTDQFLSVNQFASLAANSQQTSTANFTIPAGTPMPSTYYLCAVVDVQSSVTESDEQNNTIVQVLNIYAFMFQDSFE